MSSPQSFGLSRWYFAASPNHLFNLLSQLGPLLLKAGMKMRSS